MISRWRAHQKKLDWAPQPDVAFLKDDLPVSLTIYDIPTRLFKEFCVRVVQPRYPRGVSEAIKDLMRNAIMEKEQAPT